MTQNQAIQFKDSNKFSVTDSILERSPAMAISKLADYAETFFCIVRDRLSSNAANSSLNGISNISATLRNVSTVGDVSPLNHLFQVLNSMPVSCLKALYESFKNFSLLLTSQTYILISTKSSFVIAADNKCATMSSITQTIKHLRKQVLYRNQQTRKDGEREKAYDKYIRLRGRLASPQFYDAFCCSDGGLG